MNKYNKIIKPLIKKIENKINENTIIMYSTDPVNVPVEIKVGNAQLCDKSGAFDLNNPKESNITWKLIPRRELDQYMVSRLIKTSMLEEIYNNPNKLNNLLEPILYEMILSLEYESKVKYKDLNFPATTISIFDNVKILYTTY